MKTQTMNIRIVASLVSTLVACGFVIGCAHRPTAQKQPAPAATVAAATAASAQGAAPAPQTPPAPSVAPEPSSNVAQPKADAVPEWPLNSESGQKPAALAELSPGLWLDRQAGRLEFEGTVPIDAHDEKTPVVFLEWLVCAPDSKEHESLVLTKVKPSLIHAALLALGLEPGEPGSWDWTGKTIKANAPRGSCVRVLVRVGDLTPVDIRTWVKNLKSGQTLAHEHASEGFIFAGSRLVERQGKTWYQADREGGVVGLACFSNELVAWSRMFNPDTGVEEPLWTANGAAVPPLGTAVRVILERCQ